MKEIFWSGEGCFLHEVFSARSVARIEIKQIELTRYNIFLFAGRAGLSGILYWDAGQLFQLSYMLLCAPDRLDNFRISENCFGGPGLIVHRNPSFFKFCPGGAIEQNYLSLVQFFFEKCNICHCFPGWYFFYKKCNYFIIL